MFYSVAKIIIDKNRTGTYKLRMVSCKQEQIFKVYIRVLMHIYTLETNYQTFFGLTLGSASVVLHSCIWLLS